MAREKGGSSMKSVMQTMGIVSVVVLVLAIVISTLMVKKVPSKIAKSMSEHMEDDEDVRAFMDKMRSDERMKDAVDQFETFVRDLGAGYSKDKGRRPGQDLKTTRTASMPVVVLPGITSSMLEIWEGRDCSSYNFREKYWGSAQCARAALRNLTCWLEHLSLTPAWTDPEGIKIRVTEGYNSMDYLMPGYVVWGKVFENLADVGYDSRSLKVFSYDWRLPATTLESEDGLFSRIMYEIEFLHRRNKERVAILAHSMGCNLAFYFLNWVANERGPEWLEKYVGAWVNIAGAHLGVPKAVSCSVSGETRDTIDVGRIAQQFTGGKLNNELLRFFRSLGSVPVMLPKGDSSIWPDTEYHGLNFPMDVKKRLAEVFSADDASESKAYSPQLRAQLEKTVSRNYTVPEMVDVLDELAPDYMSRVRSMFSLGTKLNPDNSDQRTWSNPFEKALPFTDKTQKVYCLYGYSSDNLTERGYHYVPNTKTPEFFTEIPLILDTDSSDKRLNQGIAYGEGDGTVPLESLAYPCINLWNGTTPQNPAGIRTVTREYLHEVDVFEETVENIKNLDFGMPRGGPKASTHVEILGNHEVLTDLIMILTKPVRGSSDSKELEDRFYSSAQETIRIKED
mmetsp:Transcript_8793/g.39072  ORF Transcript_8793/g.39072 Transcript_8793/m.39072 type:complete len:622 (-) Transcript_8793:1423-3288(-)|eukprot:CAMPEP_0113969508 /NCGR_PEP_ID=MMETSP0011_2-20120614/10373_1 /TAXON_ID=101924 /ORGANISM="Rhodosorus marinus" /LENGTH=621 /DNA_ID=CAMNT_0000983207 /DNA_START=49 /DNA_END=1914 /DNA_ORIENTATION=- /assembly_acc=CAM_ASM_000156